MMKTSRYNDKLKDSRMFFAKFVEQVKQANPRAPRTQIVELAMSLFKIPETDKWLYFRKCTYCDSYNVRQRDGYCFNCNAYTGWYEPTGVPDDYEHPGVER